MTDEPPAYIVDTSGWIDLRKVMVVPGLQARLDALVTAGRLIVPWEVCLELEPYPDSLDKWVHAQTGCHRSTDELWDVAQVIADKYPDLVNYSKKGSADPFVIAAAIMERDKLVLVPRQAIVVASEVRHSPGRIAIPDACDLEAVRYMNLTEWFTNEGWGI